MAQLSISLDRKQPASLQLQIYQQVQQLITTGELISGDPLPPTRVLADELGVARNTVTYAFERLSNEGYVETRGTAGTFVAQNLPRNLLSQQSRTGASSSGPVRTGPLAPIVFQGTAPQLSAGPEVEYDIDMWPRRPWRHAFPASAWRRALNDCLKAEPSRIVDYNDPAGLSELRSAIARYLAPTQGIVACADQILITSGAQEGLSILARMFIAPQTPVAVENPCLQTVALTWDSAGAQMMPINVGPGGYDLGTLADANFNLFYVSPAHQFPTGLTMSVEQRLMLLEIVQGKNAYIVEDGHDSVFRFDGPPIRSLWSEDRVGCVISLGSFAVSMGAGLRLGYLVLPKELVATARTVKALLSGGVPWLEQAAMAQFMSSGGYARHLRKARSLYLSRRNNLVNAMKTAFDQVSLHGTSGGTHVLWELPEGFPDAFALRDAAAKRGVGIYTVNSANAALLGENEILARCVVLGYSSVSEKQIWEATSRIYAAVNELQVH